MLSVEVVIPIVCLGILSCAARVTLGSWLAPGAFFPLFWTALLLLSLVEAERYPIWAPALWWIDATILIFFVGSLIAKGSAVRKRQGPVPQPKPIQLPYIELLIVTCSVLGLCYIVFRESVAPDIFDEPPKWFQPLLSALYAGPVFGGMLLGSEPPRRRRKILAFISLAPTLIYSVAYLGRSPMLAGLFHCYAGFSIARAYSLEGRAPLIGLKTFALAAAVLIGTSAVGMAIGIMKRVDYPSSLRDRVMGYGEVLQDSDPEREWGNFKNSVFAHPYVFSHYLRHALDHPPTPRNGLLIFGGPLQLLGVHERTPFEDFQVDPGVQSNVYTLFRPPIDDFGLAGSFISFLIAGLLAGWAYRQISRGKMLFAPILTAFYPHVLIVGGYFFAYNTLVLCHVIVGTYLFFAHWKLRPRLAPRLWKHRTLASTATTSRIVRAEPFHNVPR